MLTETRHEKILSLVNEKGSITVTEICEELGISESTARRDIVALDKSELLTKVFGGAVAIGSGVVTKEPTVAQKLEVNEEEKRIIAKKAASLIEDGDIVYLDAGTTTGAMLSFIEARDVKFFTNCISHASYLASKGYKVILIGGDVKSSTDAIIGSEAVKMLGFFHFTKGFFGTNGITEREGFTTPDTSEALIKELAMEHCSKAYVVSDSDKFDVLSAVTFYPFDKATIITNRVKPKYKNKKNIIKA